jgi:hypothetical protein
MSAEKYSLSPFATTYQVEDWFPFTLKRLRSYLRERGIGKVIVKKRGSPLEPEVLIKQLRLKGDLERIVFLTHLKSRPIVIIAQHVVKTTDSAIISNDGNCQSR